jgi:hypothetical protein
MPLPTKLLKQVPDWTKCVAAVSQVTVVVAGCVAVFLLMRLHLDPVRPPSTGITFASAESWPEIKNGVPELVSSIRTPAQLSGAPARPSGEAVENPQEPPPSVSRNSANQPATSSVGNRVPGSAPIVAHLIEAGPADSTAQPVRDLPAVKRVPDGTAASAENLDGVMRAIPLGPEVIVSSSAGDPRREGVLAPTSPGEPRTGLQGDHTGDATPGRSAPAALSPRRENPVDAKVPPQGPRKTAALELERAGASAQQAVSRPPQPPAKIRPSTRAEINRSKTKSAKAERELLAVAQQAEYPASASTSVAQQPVQEERTRLLGIPLPTGRELQRCLLEFQC